MDDRSRLLVALKEADVAGSQDFGRFVSNTDDFEPSAFDERGAMPVLLQMLPSLSEPTTVSAVAGHLRRPWARPLAFDALLPAYRRWGVEDPLGAGWQLADALGTAAEPSHLDYLFELVGDRHYGKSRQMLVDALWRFRSDVRVSPALAALCGDADVALHAMSAYRRAEGNEAALPLLRGLLLHDDPLVRQQASRQIKKAEKAVWPRR